MENGSEVFHFWHSVEQKVRGMHCCWTFDHMKLSIYSQVFSRTELLYKCIGIISSPNYSNDVPGIMFPLPLIHFDNMMFGSGATRALPLLMFTAIRRVSMVHARNDGTGNSHLEHSTIACGAAECVEHGCRCIDSRLGRTILRSSGTDTCM